MDNCLLALVFGLLTLGGCSARVVKVSPGPLIRVEGQPVSIKCDVDEYGGPREQDFEWMMSRDANGQRIKIISTFDASYSHPSLSKRVASGDISVMRLMDNEVELKIAESSRTPSRFPPRPRPPSSQREATSPFPAASPACSPTPPTCPVTWSVKKGATSEEILSFGPQGDVSTGSKFARRYADGGIRLVPGKNGIV
ncbi:Immunoglobulin superfamily member 8 [Larimichthys crocea]|uniref:Uncharacterized protein n=1 Tax=Larimichthys crocea TaxID=215358 RepID=A0ACD3QX34_LARCR|nr:Immunoglobulin superfamily member 8 [Larimichthys crocea]